MIRKILKGVLVAFWMSLIFYFSMDSGVESTKKSDGIIIRTTEAILHRKLTTEEKKIYTEKYEVYVRKTAHFMIYFCLGLSVMWFLIEFHPLQKKDLLATIFFVFLYACSDEFHQLFIYERSGEIRDVFIDTLGGTTASCILYLFNAKKTKKDI